MKKYENTFGCRFDFHFSYWIFLWFLLYILKVVTVSPLFALWLATVYQIAVIFVLITNNSYHFFDVLLLIFSGLVVIKLMPIGYLLKYDNKNRKINKQDVLWTFILMGLYLVWIEINGLNYLSYLKNQWIEKRINTPAVNYLRKNIHNILKTNE